MEKYLSYLLLIIIVVSILILVIYIRRKNENSRLINSIKEKWGRNPLRDNKSNISKNAHFYYSNILNMQKEKQTFYVDDITWNDLEMNIVFQRINNTCSTAGEEYLYYLLRTPVFDSSVLNERERLISFFQNNRKQRMDLQVLLSKLGKTKNIDVSSYFINDIRDSAINNVNYKFLSLALLFSPLLLLLNPTIGVFAIIGLLITNSTLYYKKKYEIESHLEAFNFIVSLIDCADKIANLNIKEISRYNEALKSSLKKLKGIVSRSFLVLYNTDNPFLEYIKVIFLGEIIAYQSMFKLILKYKEELMNIFNIIGLFDSLISVASFRSSLEYYTRPELIQTEANSTVSGETDTETKNEKVNLKIYFEDIYHPLLKDPVANSLHINKSILITGSNASGKSTFLKTVALNAIFAQTINTCLAKKYVSNYFAVYTSMAIRDNLKSGESYYIAEIKSLKRIIDSLNSNIPCLCIIDEVLRGTNTVERIAASSELLYFLSKENCIIIAATHDLELSIILKNHYDNYHFQEYVTDNDIVFDYKIYPDRSRSRNAIKLLKLMGYKDDIVEASEARAQEFINQGKWPVI
ncbi:MAG TPA: DNA mismatch repair protein MutS [Clostridiaceae bacterium]|nr:DNA mismatch repair protein MutS [Clostridiaceae bacterium]